ncbi:hypothetical protein J2T14_002700 [Paenibacillus harenae]|nr:hypothetical protein [Paenibacillus harenae]
MAALRYANWQFNVMLYHYKETQNIITDLEQHPLAPIIQYFPETFSFYLITDSLWLDLFIFVGFSFLIFLFANILFIKMNNNKLLP